MNGFESKVYSPSLCNKFTTEMHTWYVLYILKGSKMYNCRINLGTWSMAQ